jgi:hypothetical protein
MGHNFHENAHNKLNKEKYEENYVAVFGEKPNKFCDVCDLRLVFCICGLEEEKEKEDGIPGTV